MPLVTTTTTLRMESKKLRTNNDDQEINTRKVILLSSSSSSTTIISSASSSSSSSSSISTIVQPDYHEEEGEYIEPKGIIVGNKRKYITGIDSSTSKRIVSEHGNRKAQVKVSEYNKHLLKDEYNKSKSRNQDNREYNDERISRDIPKSPDKKIISLLSAIASDDHKIKLSAIKSLPPFSLFNIEILKVLQSEIIKTSSSIDMRLAALDLLNEMNLEKIKAIHEVTVMLLRLSYEDEIEQIRCKALNTLEILFDIKSINWKNLPNFRRNKFVKDDDPFDVISRLPHGLNPLEVIFAVLGYVAANDTHRTVRLLAMELLSKIPGNIGVTLLYQSMKKDQQKEGAGLSKIIKKKLLKKFKDGNMSLPLLCCGVFAHGIEDQFVKIRFAALNSLFALLTASAPDNIKNNPQIIRSSMCVFLDALLDECDLIRLAALKFIRRLGKLDLTVQSGLESLLAVLDDQNGEIRTEALNIIGDNLVLSDAVDSNSTRSATINETILRTQRCVEAAILKYPEIEFKGIEAMLKLMYRDQENVKRSCNELYSHVMQCQIPKYMLPSSLLPTYTSGTLSNVHLIMQIPFMEDEKQKQARLVKIVSRMNSVDDEGKLKFLRLIRSNSIINFPLVTTAKKNSDPSTAVAAAAAKNDQVKLFKLLVTMNDNLESKYEAEKYEKGAFFFLSDSKPIAYFRINTIKIDEIRHKILIEDYNLIGSVEAVKIALMTVEALVPFEFKYGTSFVAPLNGRGKCPNFKIINLTNNEIIYKTK